MRRQHLALKRKSTLIILDNKYKFASAVQRDREIVLIAYWLWSILWIEPENIFLSEISTESQKFILLDSTWFILLSTKLHDLNE